MLKPLDPIIDKKLWDAIYVPKHVAAKPGQKLGEHTCPECYEHGHSSFCETCNGWGYTIVYQPEEEEE